MQKVWDSYIKHTDFCFGFTPNFKTYLLGLGLGQRTNDISCKEKKTMIMIMMIMEKMTMMMMTAMTNVSWILGVYWSRTAQISSKSCIFWLDTHIYVSSSPWWWSSILWGVSSQNMSAKRWEDSHVSSWW